MTVPALLSFTQLVANQAAAIQKTQATLVNFAAGSVIRALTEAVADVCLFIQSQIMQVLSQIRAATCQGGDLDSWAADYGFGRLAAVSATGQVTFSRFSLGLAVIVPVGITVQSSDGTQKFVVLADTTNSAYDPNVVVGGGFMLAPNTASVTVIVQAVNAGTQGNAQANVITQLCQALPGIDTVINTQAFNNGIDGESDAAMRARFVLYISSLSKATKNAIAAAIAGVQQGLSYTLVEDYNSAGAPSPGSFYVVVDDGTGAPPSSLIATVYSAIDAVRAAGITFAVYAPVVLPVNWSMTIAVAPSYTKSVYQPVVQAAVNAYIDSLTLGMSLPLTKLAQIAYEAAPGIVTDVSSILLNGLTSDLVATNLQVIKVGIGAVN